MLKLFQKWFAPQVKKPVRTLSQVHAALASAREDLLALKEHHQEQKASKHAHIDTLYRDMAEHTRQMNVAHDMAEAVRGVLPRQCQVRPQCDGLCQQLLLLARMPRHHSQRQLHHLRRLHLPGLRSPHPLERGQGTGLSPELVTGWG